MKKLIGSVALGTALVTGSAVMFTPTIASAQDSTAQDSTAQDSTAQESTVEDATTRPDPFAEVLDGLVADGTLTQAQADAVRAAFEANRPEGRPGGPGGHGPRGGHLEAAAEVLGTDVDTLRESLAAGDTLADIAAANGLDVQTLIDGLVADAQAHIDEHVADGSLTEDEAATKLAELEQRITDMVNGELPPGGPGRGGPGA